MLLHVTNGDAARALLKAGGCKGKIATWRDVLHEGPVPQLPLEELSLMRAAFLASRGWGTLADLRAAFAARDQTLRNHRAYDEVVLWFEHDLYDQLQLAQILSILAATGGTDRCISLICIDRHPGVARFRGLGDLKPRHVAPLFETRRAVSAEAYTVALGAWECFTSDTPCAVEAFLATDSAALPFMRAALIRHLQELPSTFNGLGRTAHHALGAIASGITDPVALLKAHWDQEAAPFLGDWSLWHRLQELARAPDPLITIAGPFDRYDMRRATLGTTKVGQSVVSGHVDAVRLRGINQWLGGVHLQGREVPWRWDSRKERLARS